MLYSIQANYSVFLLLYFLSAPPPRENDLRLVDGSDMRGRLEVYHGGQWGTVCDDHFDLVDGGVACRQLGFTSATAIEDPVNYGKIVTKF